MTTWYEQFTQKLASANTHSNATAGSVFDVARQVNAASRPWLDAPATNKAAAADPSWGGYNWAEKIFHSDALANVLGNPAVHNVLDTTLRPLYAVDSVVAEAAKQDIAHGFNPSLDPNDSSPDASWYLPDLGKYAEAFGKGWRGETKTTGNDVVNQYLAPDTQPGVNDPGDWIRALSGFGLSVATDPTMVIPGPPIKALALKAASKAGIKINPFAVDPIKNAPADIAPTAATLPHDPMVAPAVGDPARLFEAPGSPVAPLPPDAAPLPTATLPVPSAGPVKSPLDFQGTPSPKEFNPAAPATLTMPKLPEGVVSPDKIPVGVADKITAKNIAPGETPIFATPESLPSMTHPALKGLSVPKYAAKDITEPFHQIPEAVKQLPGKSIAQAIREDAAGRAIMDNPKAFGLVDTGEGIAFPNGTAIGTDELKAMARDVAAHPSKKWESLPIEVYDTGGNLIGHNAHDYMRAMTQGKTSIKGFIGNKGEYVDYASHVTDKNLKWNLSEIIGKTEITQAAATRAFTPEEKAAWRDQLSKTLTPEDVSYLSAAKTTGAFRKRMNELLAKQQTVDFNSIAELEKAAKDGLVSKDQLSKIFETLGVKSFAGAKQKLSRMDKSAKSATNPDTLFPTVDQSKVERIKGMSPPDQWTTGITSGVVKSSDEIIADAAKGDTKLIDEARGEPPVLLAPQIQAVRDAIHATVKSEYLNPRETYNFKSPKGALKESPQMYTDRARWLKSFNAKSMYTMHRNIMTRAVEMLPKNAAGKGLSGAERQSALYDLYMPMIKSVETTFRDHHIEPNIAVAERGLPLSFGDILEVLPRPFVEKFVMNRTTLTPSVLMEMAKAGVEMVLRSGRPDKAGSEAMQLALLGTLQKDLGKNVKSVSKDAAYIVKTMGEYSKELAQRVEVNSARVNIDFGKNTKAIEFKTVKAFTKDLEENWNHPSSILSMVDNFNHYVTTAVRDMNEMPLPGADAMAADAAKASIAEGLPVPELQTEAKAARELKGGADPAAVGTRLIDSAEKAVEDMGLKTLDLAENAVFSSTYRFIRGIAPHLANKDLRPLLLQNENATRRLATEFSKTLNQIEQRYSRADITEAFKRIQNAEKIPTAGVESDLLQAMQYAFDTSADGLGVMSRMGVAPEQINRQFARFGIPNMFEMKDAESWRGWKDVKDPTDLMHRMYGAMGAAHAENILGHQINHFFGASKTPQKGFVKITDTTGVSALGRSIDQSLYFPEEIARQMPVLEKTLQELAKPRSVNKFWQVIDSAMHTYKAQLTIYRPGHHMRNMYGDVWLAAMDGMWNPSYYKEALKVMGQRPKNYSDWNMNIDSFAPKGVGGVARTLRHEGKDVPLTYEDIYRLGLHHGIFPEYTTVEDISMATDAFNLTRSGISGNLSKVNPLSAMDKLTGGKIHPGQVHAAATKVSELRDHYVRAAHFMYAMDQAGKTLEKGLSLEDALSKMASKASERTRRWHPDGSDYSQFEKTYLRRTVLFYSWVRKAIPLVLETAAFKPGRFMLYPKAMYSLAEANGVDLTGQGYGTPFPADQLFPEWMTSGSLGPTMGKSGGYIGMNPGVPATDVLDSYFNLKDPSVGVKNVISGLAPYIKDPFEIGFAPKGDVAVDSHTGAPVKTWTDYLTNQIPNASTAEGLGVEFPGATPQPKSNTGYAPNFPGGKPGMTVANWLTGLGFRDMSKPSYQNSAIKERQKAVTKR